MFTKLATFVVTVFVGATCALSAVEAVAHDGKRVGHEPIAVERSNSVQRCSYDSTEYSYDVSLGEFESQREAINLALREIEARTDFLPKAAILQVPKGVQQLSIIVDSLTCSRGRDVFSGTSVHEAEYSPQSCTTVGCVEGWPGSGAPEGSTMTITSCGPEGGNNVSTISKYKMQGGQWVMTSYQVEQVTHCDPL